MSTNLTQSEISDAVYVSITALLNDVPREEFVKLMMEGIPEEDISRAYGISISIIRNLLSIIAELTNQTTAEVWQSICLAVKRQRLN